MSTSRLFIVCLREPVSPTDYREDPYWETGSFGCTGCHSSNLLNLKSMHLKNGDRLAFSQGGDQGARLVLITPPISLHRNGEYMEVKWEPVKPFRYEEAPLLIDSSGRSSFPLLRNFISTSASKNWRHKFSSKFRSRAQSLPENIAHAIYERFQRHKGFQITTYLEALPLWPSWESWSYKNRPVTYPERIKAYKQKFGARSIPL